MKIIKQESTCVAIYSHSWSTCSGGIVAGSCCGFALPTPITLELMLPATSSKDHWCCTSTKAQHCAAPPCTPMSPHIWKVSVWLTSLMRSSVCQIVPPHQKMFLHGIVDGGCCVWHCTATFRKCFCMALFMEESVCCCTTTSRGKGGLGMLFGIVVMHHVVQKARAKNKNKKSTKNSQWWGSIGYHLPSVQRDRVIAWSCWSCWRNNQPVGGITGCHLPWHPESAGWHTDSVCGLVAMLVCTATSNHLEAHGGIWRLMEVVWYWAVINQKYF